MSRSTQARRWRRPGIVVSALAVLTVVACTSSDTSSPTTTSTPATSAPSQVTTAIFVNGNVVTMNPQAPSAQAVAVANGTITAVGTNEQIRALAPPGLSPTDMNGATVLPGFIDPHSHMSAYAFYNDPDNWIDVSAINDYFRPPPGDPRCAAPDNPQECFIPVTNQDDVVARIAKRVADVKTANPAQPAPVLAYNYDPSRLGRSSNCPLPDGVAFQCPNFENGRALEQLDTIANDVPIYVTAQSGHISYVNTPGLKLLNICGTTGQNPDQAANPCYEPNINPVQEKALANLGQLDEDASLYATGVFQNMVFAMPQNKGKGATLLSQAAAIYAQHGYTLVQEGMADIDTMKLYNEVQTGPQSTFPVSAAMLAYDATSGDFAQTLSQATQGQSLFGNNPLLTVAAAKSFADGSPQGYTAYLNEPYKQWFSPFDNATVFPQPYRGLPDAGQAKLAERLVETHKAGFPLVIHQIGDAASTDAVNALEATKDTPPPAGKNDVVLHVPMISPEQLERVAALKTAVVSTMPGNVYFFNLPECQQVIGRERIVNNYPSREAIDKTGRVTLHSDTPVTPPDPLFSMWAAVTRSVQQPAWYPNRDPSACPPVSVSDEGAGDQRITIAEAIKGYTADAAHQYGMTQRGSIEVGKYADMVMLSADPLSEETVKNPDNLKTIQVLGTVRYGTAFPNPNAGQPVIWPG